MATILTTLCTLPGFQPVEAYVTTPVQAGPLYRSDYGWLCAHYGYQVAYDATGGATNDRYFYPALEVVTQGLDGYGCYYTISTLKITVTGTKPDGSPVSGSEFTDLAQINSPQDPGYEWLGAFTAVYNVLKGFDPSHITSAITLGQPTGASTGYNSQSAWATWPASSGMIQKGLQFRFRLHCDPSLGGTYTLTIKYHLEIRAGGAEGYVVNTSDLYQTITYEFTPPHVSSITGSGFVSGYGVIWDTNNMLGYEADDDVALIGTYTGGAGYISGMMNAELSGSNDIWLHGYSTIAGAHVYVYVSTDGYNWQYVYDRMIDPDGPNEPHYVGTTTLTFRYILICSFNNFSNYPSALWIDCVTTA